MMVVTKGTESTPLHTLLMALKTRGALVNRNIEKRMQADFPREKSRNRWLNIRRSISVHGWVDGADMLSEPNPSHLVRGLSKSDIDSPELAEQMTSYLDTMTLKKYQRLLNVAPLHNNQEAYPDQVKGRSAQRMYETTAWKQRLAIFLVRHDRPLYADDDDEKSIHRDEDERSYYHPQSDEWTKELFMSLLMRRDATLEEYSWNPPRSLLHMWTVAIHLDGSDYEYPVHCGRTYLRFLNHPGVEFEDSHWFRGNIWFASYGRSMLTSRKFASHFLTTNMSAVSLVFSSTEYIKGHYNSLAYLLAAGFDLSTRMELNTVEELPIIASAACMMMSVYLSSMQDSGGGVVGGGDISNVGSNNNKNGSLRPVPPSRPQIYVRLLQLCDPDYHDKAKGNITAKHVGHSLGLQLKRFKHHNAARVLALVTLHQEKENVPPVTTTTIAPVPQQQQQQQLATPYFRPFKRYRTETKQDAFRFFEITSKLHFDVNAKICAMAYDPESDTVSSNMFNIAIELLVGEIEGTMELPVLCY